MSLDIYGSAYADCAEKLHSIEEELRTQPVTWERHQQIVQELDVVHGDLSQLEKTAAAVNRFTQSFLNELRQKTIFLYGEADDFFYQHEVEVIQLETDVLVDILDHQNLQKIKNLIGSLKAHINELLESFSPKLQDRRILVFAKLNLERAEALLNGQSLTEDLLSEWNFLETEAIIEEVAEYLGSNDRYGLRLLWNRLTSVQKKLVMAYLEPKDFLTSFLHDAEGPTDERQAWGG